MHKSLNQPLLRQLAGASLFVMAVTHSAGAQSNRDSFLVEVPATSAPAAPAPVLPAAKSKAEPTPAEAPAPKNAVLPEAPLAKAAEAPKAEPQIVPLVTDGRGPDESALRYYASLQQVRRTETEIKRLKRLYPDWEPPENIFNTPAAGSVDEQPLWDLFAVGKLDELRADIDKRMKKEPGWQPSADLMDKIRRKETRMSITALWKSGKWKDLIAYVKGSADAVGDDADVDILWTVAEAYAKTKATADALATYKSILKNNREPEQRLATVQKAMSVLRMSDVEELLLLAKKDSRGRSEFDGISIDVTRGRISAFLHDERSEPIPDAEQKAFEEFARKDKDPNQPGLVAWYYYKTKSYSSALEWFKHAIAQGGDSMIAHGLAHSLRELGLYRDTEEVSYAWREPLVNNSILFIDILERDLTKEIPPYIEPERLLRYAQVTMDNASGEGAQGLAWYAYNSCQFKVAHEWFERAVAWLPKEATVYGYALTLQKVKKSKEFWDVLNRYDGLFPKVIDIIYPDDLYHPPTPCDMLENKTLQRAQQQTPQGYRVPAPYVANQPYASQPYSPPPAAAAPGQFSQGYGGAPSAVAPAVPAAAAQPFAAQAPANPYANPYGAQPAPVQGQAGYYQNPAQVYQREPKIDRKNFPVSVDVQNPLRFHPTGRYLGPQAQAATRMTSPSSPLVNEPPIGMRQVVARRVPDVGRMPYERWGYTLLPGYNGINAPTGPHNAEKAPAGSLWTTLQARDAAATKGGAFDAIRQDVAALLQLMNSIPRVPPPSASITGPWRSPPPYKSREQLEAEGLLAPANVSAGPADLSRQPSAVPSASAIAPKLMGQDATPQARTTALPLLATNPAAPRPVESPAPSRPEERVQSYAKDALGQQAADLYNRKQYSEALDVLNQRSKTMAETTDLRLIRAWSLLNLNRVDEAKRVFSTLSATTQPRAAGAEANNRRTR